MINSRQPERGNVQKKDAEKDQLQNKTRTKADKIGELSADKADTRRRQIRITSNIMSRHSLEMCMVDANINKPDNGKVREQIEMICSNLKGTH